MKLKDFGMQLTIGIGNTSSIDKECGIYRRGIKTPNYPGSLYLMRDSSDNVTRNAKAACGLMRLGTRHTMETIKLGTVWKSPSKQLLLRALLPGTIFCSALGSSSRPPTSPSNVVAKKSTHFHPFCSKSNFVWGGRGGVASFSNITGKVPTLLTSIVGDTIFHKFNKLLLLLCY